MLSLSIPSLIIFIASLLAFVFLEGLFFFTRPSFISLTEPATVFSAVFVASFFVVFIGVFLWGFFWGLEFLLRRYLDSHLRLTLLPSAFVLALLALLLLDNFTYTVFHIGIISTDILGRLVYVGLFSYTIFYLFHRLTFFVHEKKELLSSNHALLTLALPLGLAFIFFMSKAAVPLKASLLETGVLTKRTRPNIIFFASDGVDAQHLKLYGYARNTTPTLNRFAHDRKPLLCKNAFSNGARTTGSLTAMLTGVSPATNKVFFPPHILNATNAHRHLPGILKQLGYINFQETIRYYADAGDLNLQGAFDVANNRSLKGQNFLGRRFVTESYFLAALFERLSSRLLHITGVRSMENFAAQMNNEDSPNEVYGTIDDTRMERLEGFIEQVKEPFFAHVHLLDSHCCTFKFKHAHFSRRTAEEKETKTQPLERDLIDDAILASDAQFARVLKVLKERGILERTIVVYSSDHNRGWTIKRKVPLVFFFPDSHYARIEKKNCQLLDVAPTLLDYLDIKTPHWLEGRSLLDEANLDNADRIFGFLNIRRHSIQVGKSKVSELVDAGAPYYGLTSYGMMSCNKWYELNLNNGKMKSGKISGYSGGCEKGILPTELNAKKEIVQYLSSKKLGMHFQKTSAK
ncbi:MAG TPA: sulfatase-like hydrolase/transferase [Turneriella sp.]|nr:sulfatase-like hydrolase/transferase [Turneriella sp.]